MQEVVPTPFPESVPIVPTRAGPFLFSFLSRLEAARSGLETVDRGVDRALGQGVLPSLMQSPCRAPFQFRSKIRIDPFQDRPVCSNFVPIAVGPAFTRQYHELEHRPSGDSRDGLHIRGIRPQVWLATAGSVPESLRSPSRRSFSSQIQTIQNRSKWLLRAHREQPSRNRRLGRTSRFKQSPFGTGVDRGLCMLRLLSCSRVEHGPRVGACKWDQA